MPANLEVSIEINATPAQVWAVVSDPTRMPEWSPQTRRVLMRGESARLGSTTYNVNRRGAKIWVTRSKVTHFEPDRRIAWTVKENRAVWSFDLESLDDGTHTRLIQRRDVSNDTSKISKALIERFLGGEQAFERELTTGMRQTLQRIRLETESHTQSMVLGV